MTTASDLPERALIEAFAAAGPEAVDAGNAWLAAYRAETGRSSVTVDGAAIPLPEAVGDDIEGRLDDPLLVGCALWGAALADPGTAREIQSALEAVGPRGWVAVIGAAVAAVGSVVGGALGLSASKRQQAAARDTAEAARLNLEATQTAAAATIAAAEQRTRQVTTLVIGGLALAILAAIVWGGR